MKLLILFILLALPVTFAWSLDIESALNSINQNKDCNSCNAIPILSHQKSSILTDANKEKIEMTVLNLEEANQLVTEFYNNKNIPFDYALDGCYARAEKMAVMMEEKGIVSAKAFVMGRLFANTKYGPASWRYHVASVVLVKINDELKPYIIDPALFKNAVPYTEWKNLITGAGLPGRKPAPVYEYYTNRFVYDPTNAKTKLESYQQADLASADATLIHLQDIKDQLDKKLVSN